MKVLENLGHQTIDWKPTPSHDKLMKILNQCWSFDGGADLIKDFELSGEEAAPQTLVEPSPQATGSDIMAVNITKREYQKEYMEYWNSTADLTDTGRPVDAIIAPVAPWPAARPANYKYYGYTGFVNLLDYTSVVIPVLLADKAIDTKNESFQALNEVDQASQDCCKYRRSMRTSSTRFE